MLIKQLFHARLRLKKRWWKEMITVDAGRLVGYLPSHIQKASESRGNIHHFRKGFRVEFPRLVQSLNSPFFPPPIRAEPGRAKRELSFRPPGFSPYRGREERRIQGQDYPSSGNEFPYHESRIPTVGIVNPTKFISGIKYYEGAARYWRLRGGELFKLSVKTWVGIVDVKQRACKRPWRDGWMNEKIWFEKNAGKKCAKCRFEPLRCIICYTYV